MALLAALYIFSCLLIIGLAIPLIQRRIKPNMWYGFRTPTTLKNPDIWYEVNEYTGRLLLYSAGATLIASVVLLFVPGITIDGYAALAGGVMGLGATYSTIMGFIRIRQILNK